VLTLYFTSLPSTSVIRNLLTLTGLSLKEASIERDLKPRTLVYLALWMVKVERILSRSCSYPNVEIDVNRTPVVEKFWSICS